MISTLKKTNKETLDEINEEMNIRKTKEVFLLFPLGSQFDHLIKQCIEKLGVFCLVADPGSIKAEDVVKLNPIGIILSGGPVSVYNDPPEFDANIFDLGIPVLGICLGFQLWAKHVGCNVVPAKKKEFGVHMFCHGGDSELFAYCDGNMTVLESHGDIVKTPDIFRLKILGKTPNTSIAAASRGHLYGVQFHPEVTETEFGPQIFKNFCFKICAAKDEYPAEKVAANKVLELWEKIGEKKVLLALSGGSDSSTVAYLLKEAMKDSKEKLRGVYIKGIDRPDDEAYVFEYFGNKDWLDLRIIDATKDFLAVLKGKISMPDKRIAMRGVYKVILEKEAREFGADFIAQGTLYTDISESGGGYDTLRIVKAQIKLHHNVNLGFSKEELMPLSDCVKDSGRNIGRSIGVPEELLIRHPFPGPGLVVRIEGEVTAEKLNIAHKIDEIYIEELRRQGLYQTIWQAGAVVTQSKITGSKGDDATHGIVVALWAVWSVNGFTAQAAELPWEFVKLVSRLITNEVPEVGAVVYRTSDKPPSTIEWG